MLHSGDVLLRKRTLYNVKQLPSHTLGSIVRLSLDSVDCSGIRAWEAVGVALIFVFLRLV